MMSRYFQRTSHTCRLLLLSAVQTSCNSTRPFNPIDKKGTSLFYWSSPATLPSPRKARGEFGGSDLSTGQLSVTVVTMVPWLSDPSVKSPLLFILRPPPVLSSVDSARLLRKLCFTGKHTIGIQIPFLTSWKLRCQTKAVLGINKASETPYNVCPVVMELKTFPLFLAFKNPLCSSWRKGRERRFILDVGNRRFWTQAAEGRPLAE